MFKPGRPRYVTIPSPSKSNVRNLSAYVRCAANTGRNISRCLESYFDPKATFPKFRSSVEFAPDKTEPDEVFAAVAIECLAIGAPYGDRRAEKGAAPISLNTA